ncbi:MAG: DNA polymerase III subunit beta [Bacteroidia bacterium]|nr:DNA polymerase III subunit beta [Bacteroidia bacterium]MCX7764833.1 DNA polymerase III subunit beta [Bacteroidia bacterium]MDW8057913.1 DNA polymerase III subunit beta [Bacteroidia bacterium]
MAFRVRVEALREALGRVMPIIPSARPLYPISKNILLYQTTETLEIRATDLEVSIRTVMNVLPEEGDSVHLVVSPKPLMDLLKGFGADEVITATQQDHTLRLSSSYGVYEFGGLPFSEFPEFPQVEGQGGVSFPIELLEEVVSQTAFAASKDSARIALTGIYFDFADTHTNFVATDAHTLVRLKRTDIRLPDAPKLLLPVRALQSLQQALKGFSSGDTLTLYPAEGQALFHHPMLDMVCRLIDAKYPDYQSVIPQKPPYSARINTNLFKGALRRLLVLSDKTSNLIRFSFEGNTLTLSAQDADQNLSGSETLRCEYEGPDFRIAFRGSVIGGVIDHIQAEDFILRMEAPGRAVVIEPDPQTPPAEALFLAMPLIV